ncbi:DUF1501 domain-containing protein [Kineosporia sp. NBRC 101731]|uniref:DUF1501 domain-containing protein n=1 Tax=Kineosporia sp. NBRC 101731 TaxID=3032199 RepID=UPI0024A1999D|nr:DUF1501 domain-containing protein [Kineosporia sp. NBRC 101731]GLY28030.1 hypothetical protein Kisp02_13950 [Kineosporia sp. NBRC 101731]
MTTMIPQTPEQMLDCGCPENRGVSRRTLFRMAAVGGLTTATTLSGATLAFGAPAGTGTLVVLSLRGGFDGLSAVIPLGDAAYAKARPGIKVAAGQAHKLDSMFGLHPAMEPVFKLFDNGTMAAVHAVGQADPTRSHFEAMEEMERAAPDSNLRTGWIDRTLGSLGNPGGFGGTQVGSGAMPDSMIGPNMKFAMNSIAGVKLSVGEDLVPLARWRSAMKTLHTGAAPELKAPLSNALGAVGKMGPLQKATSKTAKELGYPDTGLGNALHDVARLIKADLGLRVATVDYGNWDMHVNLGRSDAGWMFNQLKEMSTALAAFAAELGTAGLAKTNLITLSEFGRRLEENGSGGLDHGHGNVVLALGGGLKKGVHGRWPGLGASALVDGDLAGTTDYRSIVSEVLKKRVGVDSTTDIFPGYKAKTVGLVA